MKTRVAVTGACGRMGRKIIKVVSEQSEMEVVLAADLNNVDESLEDLMDVKNLSLRISHPRTLLKDLKDCRASILVDFTNPDATLSNSKAAAIAGCSLVIGTTGLKVDELEAIKKHVQEGNVSAVISPNMSTGVNIFFKLVKDASVMLGRDYDIEILEMHHRNKKDAPSGTAIQAGKYITEVIGEDFSKNAVFGREGMVGERKKDEIGVHAIRAGDIVGEHTILFAGDGERIEITHRAHSRDAFVNGVVKAIRFLTKRKNHGKVYSTWDVLDIA